MYKTGDHRFVTSNQLNLYSNRWMWAGFQFQYYEQNSHSSKSIAVISKLSFCLFPYTVGAPFSMFKPDIYVKAWLSKGGHLAVDINSVEWKYHNNHHFTQCGNPASCLYNFLSFIHLIWFLNAENRFYEWHKVLKTVLLEH